jgi:hypothetical protein
MPRLAARSRSAAHDGLLAADALPIPAPGNLTQGSRLSTTPAVPERAQAPRRDPVGCQRRRTIHSGRMRSNVTGGMGKRAAASLAARPALGRILPLTRDERRGRCKGP